jgi:hypothetical protein
MSLHRAIPIVSLALSCFAALTQAAPLPGRYPVSEPVIAPNPGRAGAAAIASTGRTALAVWSEVRGSDQLLMMQWVDPATGAPLEALPIVLGQGVSVGGVAVATDGHKYLIAWRTDGRIIGRLVEENGQQRDLGVIASSVSFALASNGRHWLLVATTQTLQTLLLDDSGRILRHEDLGAYVGAPEVATDGEGFLVAARRNLTTLLVPIDSSGVAGEPQVTALPEGARLYNVSVGASGDQYLVARQLWRDHPPKRSQVTVQAVGGDGVPLAAPAEIESPFVYDVQPRLTSIGSQPLLFFHGSSGDDRSQLMSVALTPNGAPLTAPRSIGPPVPHSGFQVTSGPATALVSTAVGAHARFNSATWSEERRSSAPYLWSIDRAGIDRGAHPLSYGVPSQDQLTAAWGSDDLLMVWTERIEVSLVSTLFARRLTDEENRRGRGVAASERSQEWPSLRRGGDRFGLVWTEIAANDPFQRGAVVFQIVDRDGESLSGVPLPLDESASASPATVGWDGRFFVVVWRNLRGQLVATRVTPEGQRWDLFPIPLMPQGETGIEPQLEWTGDRFLMVWRREYPTICYTLCPTSPLTIHVGAYSAELTRLNEPRLVAGPPSGPPAVAWSGDELIVVFAGEGLRARQVTPEGDLIGPAEGVLLAGRHASAPRAGFDGRNYIVMWEAGSEGLKLAHFDRALRLAVSPRLLRPAEGSGTAIWTDWAAATGHALAVEGERIAAGYLMRLDHMPFLGVRRLMLHLPPRGRSRSAARGADSGAVVNGWRSVQELD